jgi:hypothetical protein
MTRRYVRDGNGRFSGGGGGTVSAGRRPRAKKPGGEMTRRLRAGVEGLKQADRQRMLGLTGRVAGPVLDRTSAKRQSRAAQTKPATGKASGRMTDALGSSLRALAQSDARYYRALQAELKPKALKGKTTKRLKSG